MSLDAQRAKLKAYAELYELALVEVIVDAGHSAKSLNRPGLQRALGMLVGEAEALLVVKLDRLTRSVVDLGTLVERYFAPGKAAFLDEEDPDRLGARRAALGGSNGSVTRVVVAPEKSLVVVTIWDPGSRRGPLGGLHPKLVQHVGDTTRKRRDSRIGLLISSPDASGLRSVPQPRSPLLVRFGATSARCAEP